MQEGLTEIFVSANYLHRGDLWKASVRPRDRYGDFGVWMNSTPIIIEGSAPRILSFSCPEITLLISLPPCGFESAIKITQHQSR